jgi:peptidoglycan/xylan/chitin deacetylase (PgdA/CDA1 family)
MPKYVMMTFDDGFEPHYFYVLDLLKKYNMRAIFALITKEFDQFWTIDKINDVINSGSVIYSHTETHKDMQNDYDENDVVVSLEKLKKKNIPLNGFVVPYYKYNKQVKDLLVSYGIKYSMNYGARSCNNKKIYYDSVEDFKKNALDLVRYSVPYTSKEHGSAAFSQVESIVNNMKDGGVVIINFHNILKKSDVSPYDIRFYLDYDELEKILILFKENSDVVVSLPGDFE